MVVVVKMVTLLMADQQASVDSVAVVASASPWNYVLDDSYPHSTPSFTPLSMLLLLLLQLLVMSLLLVVICIHSYCCIRVIVILILILLMIPIISNMGGYYPSWVEELSPSTRGYCHSERCDC
mmetsp:Transcript_50186/g.51072  ORF Transcript_50186/g.51072 Transcript_50186/m.51072 type:complete len:123 (-) Transcript_50186:186-554(-)